MEDRLTATQEKALAYICECIDATGAPPTLREICEAMGYSSVGSAQDVIAALRKKGFLETPGRQAARAFVLTAKARHICEGVSDKVVRLDSDDVYVVPCLGAVPAGNPIEAIEERIDEIRVSANLLPTPRPHANQLFALRAQGLSMVGAGILDGDWLVIKSQNEAEPGNIVVARLDGDVTVKRLSYERRSGWFLKPENPDFTSIFGSETPFEIIGKVVALQRVI